MACLVLREEASWVMRTTVLNPFPRRFFARFFGRTPPDRMVLKPPRERTWNFLAPSRASAGNVRAGTGTGPRFGHRVPKSGPTGWAIPPDPQQARGGQIPVR